MIAAAMVGTDLRLWIASAAMVLALHVAGVSLLARWHEPLMGDEATAAIVVDLTPFTSPENESRDDIAPGPVQQQSDPAPEPQPPEPNKKVEERIEPLLPAPNPEIVLPPEPVRPPEPPKEQTAPPAEATAPPPPRPSAAQVSSWHRKIATQVERHKGYPTAARARHETGIMELVFTIDRQGTVVASRIARSSGFAALDREALATVRRAQPFPPPPPNLPGTTFEFTVPIRFKVR
jgi:protein TonB